MSYGRHVAEEANDRYKDIKEGKSALLEHGEERNG